MLTKRMMTTVKRKNSYKQTQFTYFTKANQINQAAALKNKLLHLKRFVKSTFKDTELLG